MIETSTGIFYAIHLLTMGRDGNKEDLLNLGEFATFQEALDEIERGRIRLDYLRSLPFKPYANPGTREEDEELRRLHNLMSNITVDEMTLGGYGAHSSEVVWNGVHGKPWKFFEERVAECLRRAVNVGGGGVTEESIQRIAKGLVVLLAGENKLDTIQACLSIATRSARLAGVSQMDLQKQLVTLYDRRVEEEAKARASQ